VALRASDSGATLAVAGIWLSDIPELNYTNELFRERRLRT
jgi:propanol-preferring alcohol dehydrogenase